MTAVKLSVTSKLDGIPSWSLQAVDTCPGAHAPGGGLVTVCQGCYARAGNYRRPRVKNVRAHNRWHWREVTWVDDMVAALDLHHYLRWFDSGDVYDWRLALKIHEVIKRTPWVKHWLPTRSYKIPHIRLILELINREPNAVVRYSADELDTAPPGTHGAAVTTHDDAVPGAFICQAYRNTPAKCNGCRACWDKGIPIIGYPGHGDRMKKIAAA